MFSHLLINFPSIISTEISSSFHFPIIFILTFEFSNTFPMGSQWLWWTHATHASCTSIIKLAKLKKSAPPPPPDGGTCGGITAISSVVGGAAAVAASLRRAPHSNKRRTAAAALLSGIQSVSTAHQDDRPFMTHKRPFTEWMNGKKVTWIKNETTTHTQFPRNLPPGKKYRE